jgi:glycerol-3-phosphate dehydrogenase (NAD(P)+)
MVALWCSTTTGEPMGGGRVAVTRTACAGIPCMEQNQAATERNRDVAGANGRLAGRLSSVESVPPDSSRGSGASAPRLDVFREHALEHGVNPVLYRIARAILLPFFLLYFRLERPGREHIPDRGPVLLAANHRSFLDPFVIGALTRRPVYYMAKRELFERRWQAWLLNSLGAFPVDRGAGDEHAMATARQILERGDCVVIFPEGTRVRPGPLGRPHRGVGRLALQTGARVLPVAVMGTEDVRRGWRVRPRKVTIRCGRPLGFPIAEHPSPSIALGVTERIWACVSLQWEWLGGASAAGPSELRDGSSQGRARAA